MTPDPSAPPAPTSWRIRVAQLMLSVPLLHVAYHLLAGVFGWPCP
jgi:hypothetical protein